MRYVSLLITLLIGGLYAYHALHSAGQVAQKGAGFPGVPPSVAAQVAAATKGEPAPEKPRATTAVAKPAPTATPALAAATPDPARGEIEGQIKALKVTSILPGDPGLVIIDKQSYAEGDDLPLGKGRKLRVAKVDENGVTLASNGQTYHLDAPAAPDLAASRKPR